MKNISILGCGWLGLPLGKALLKKGFPVKGSTTTREKMQELTAEGITPYHIQIFAEGVQGDISSFLSDAEVLIIDIPPGLRKNPEENYAGKIGRLKDYIEKSSVKKVIFISSTSVYKDTEDFTEYFESDLPNSEGKDASQLIAAEQIIQSEGFETTIIRFGGLIGPGRHPVNYLSNKKELSNPEAPVNLIHLNDCLAILSFVIENDINVKLINAVFPEHPSKEEYYTKIAEVRNLAIPKFNNSETSKGKIISSEVLTGKFEYKFSETIWK